MAVTGTGTKQDPYIVHSYDEFISLSGHGPVADSSVYIKWFDSPNQVLDCNVYGSEFKWGAFTDTGSTSINVTYYIDLNGCTIKNFLIADGATMFTGHYYSVSGKLGKIIVSNGFIRNVFMGSATSKFCGDYVEFENVSISLNFAGSTVTQFQGDGHLSFDNCAMYLVGSTLQAKVFTSCTLSDTDIELHINNLNEVAVFAGTSSSQDDRTILTDCRLQGKLSGAPKRFVNDIAGVLGCTENYYISSDKMNLINCVVDLDISGVTGQFINGLYILYAHSSGLNTTVYCKDHYPTGVTPPSNWNYLTHEEMRNGATLNAKGFTVVEVVDGD